MCLTIPGKIVEIKKNEFVIDYGSEKRVVNLSAVPVKKGDYVIVKNKIIIDKVNKHKFKEFLKYYNE